MEKSSEEKFALDILQTIKQAQLQNGLRHGDYERYRDYCTRRIRRICKSLHFLHGRTYHKRDIDPHHCKDVRYLELVLMTTERAWAFAMALKEDVANYRSKFHAARRMNKACKWAKKLESLCDAVADQRTILEGQSYANWFEGNILLDKADWIGAQEKLIRAKTVYEELGKVGTQEQQERCRERVSEIEPTVRYCQFSIEGQDQSSLARLKTQAETQHGLDLLKTQLDGVLADIRKKEVDSMNELTWKGNKIPIKNESVRMSILSADSILKFELLQAASVEQKAQLFDKVFINYNDAIRQISSDINHAKNTKKPAADIKNLEELKEYMTYTKIDKTIQRNVMLVDSLENRLEKESEAEQPKADEIVRLYEILIENITELNNLGENTDKSIKDFAAMLLSYKAFRCLYLGSTYAKLSKWAEARALFSRCQQQIVEAIDHHKECDIKNLEMIEKLNGALVKAQALESQAHAQGFLDTMQQRKNESNAKSTSIEVNTESSEARTLEPIPCKPLLFDLAVLSCKYPDLKARLPKRWGFW